MALWVWTNQSNIPSLVPPPNGRCRQLAAYENDVVRVVRAGSSQPQESANQWTKQGMARSQRAAIVRSLLIWFWVKQVVLSAGEDMSASRRPVRSFKGPHHPALPEDS